MQCRSAIESFRHCSTYCTVYAVYYHQINKANKDTCVKIKSVQGQVELGIACAAAQVQRITWTRSTRGGNLQRRTGCKHAPSGPLLPNRPRSVCMEPEPALMQGPSRIAAGRGFSSCMWTSFAGLPNKLCGGCGAGADAGVVMDR